MMTNLFSTFDPSTSSSMSFNWLSLLTSLLLIPIIFWMIPTRSQVLWSSFVMKIHKEMKMLLMDGYSLGISLVLISLMWMIMVSNMAGLFPYIFTPTSHMVVTMSLTFPLWFTLMVYGWLNNTNKMFTHLMPQGTPPLLMVFMILIESVSNLIRPLTLAIRLSANMIAGHLLLTLLGNQGSIQNSSYSLMVIFVQFFLLILEMAVAMIQSYVFIVLVGLYSTEIH